MIITPSTCSAIDKSVLLNCNLTCEFGLQRGVGGCLQCSCAALSCFSVCLYGHSFYESTRRSCECRSAGCKRIHCDKICIHGFQESNQCTVCKCRPCPKLNCTNTCIYGIRFNSYGCLTCDCLKGNERIQNEPMFHQCLHEDKTVDHMEIFYDGCRQCICLNGTTLCSLISCSSANICPTMTFNPGDCCPRCTLDDHRSIQIKIPDILNNLCVGSLGRPLPDGESLIIDKCTTCKCFMGKAFCSVAQCEQPLSNCSLPVSSISPFNIFGSCCPVCSMSNKLVTSDLTNKSLSSARQRCVDGQVVHSDGDIWISNVCQSCICRNGITYCYPHRCPLLSCSVAVLKKGTCCPFCLERALMTVCIFNENVYRNGDGWNISDCSSCVCSKGQIVCTRTLCSPLRCKLPVLLPGHCCPICLGF
ncbi:hypothetical protein GJ496_004885 [Pomphorhynchus laevis]|nr:hypothetical protein GJ496_004885 [Pomphorhynchus laevis]